ncbi:MAG: alpha/beta hydrolase [Nanoarchaeota archaeon]|nr:alpha/beta hydrolase [Nanoarchaeota archaeon]
MDEGLKRLAGKTPYRVATIKKSNWIIFWLILIILASSCHALCFEPDIIAHKQCLDAKCGTGYLKQPGCSDPCYAKLQEEQDAYDKCMGEGEEEEECQEYACQAMVTSDFDGVSADGVSKIKFTMVLSGDYEEFGLELNPKGGETLKGKVDKISDKEIAFTPDSADKSKNYLAPQEAYAVGWCIPKMAACETQSPETYLSEKPFTIEQPPLFFVHGIWSSAESWETFRMRVRKEGWHHGYISYSSQDDNKYNAKLLSDELQKFIQMVKDGKIYNGNRISATGKKISATKVDIVSHSMGGLVTRYYIGSYMYQNNIRKFIMMGTPNHGAWGTKVLDTLLNKAFESIWGVPTYLTLQQMKPNAQFIIDLNKQPLRQGIEYYTIAGTGWWTTKGLEDIYFTWRGDGVVLVDSVKLPNVPLYCVTNIHSTQVRWFPGWEHPLMALGGWGIRKDITLTTSEESYGTARNLLIYGSAINLADCDEEPKPTAQLIAWLKCPATLHAYDENGNHLGLNKNGQVENTIGEGAYYVTDSDETVGQAIRINGDKKIKFVIVGNESGSIDFTFMRVSDDGNVTENYFENVSIDKKTQYTFDTSNEALGLVKGEVKVAESGYKWYMPAIAIFAIVCGILILLTGRKKRKT